MTVGVLLSLSQRVGEVIVLYIILYPWETLLLDFSIRKTWVFVSQIFQICHQSCFPVHVHFQKPNSQICNLCLLIAQGITVCFHHTHLALALLFPFHIFFEP